VTPFEDRVAGALVGAATGDALGAGYEFESAPFEGRADMIGGGLGGSAPGEWTDDTAMTVCIAEVTAAGRVDLHAIASRFLDWFRSGPPDIGNQTRGVLGGARTPGEVSRRATERFERLPSSSAGNGALMRTAPVALAHLGDDDAIATAAHAVSELTHADPLSGEACVLWCIAVDRAVREERLDGVRDGLSLLPSHRASLWDGWLRDAESGPPERFRPNGFVVTALQAAYSATTSTPVPGEPEQHLEEVLHRVIAIGDDTDTTAAIAGALVGARWGASAVRPEWRRMLHGWPGITGDDLSELALRTVADHP
jgi:ADP-ribosyl-[dinitrogen reductase] hydrolase